MDSRCLNFKFSFIPGSSESHGTEKGKRSLSSRGTPTPKKLRPSADAQEGKACVVCKRTGETTI